MPKPGLTLIKHPTLMVDIKDSNPAEVEIFEQALTPEEKKDLEELISLNASYDLEYLFSLSIEGLTSIQLERSSAFWNKVHANRTPLKDKRLDSFELEHIRQPRENLALKKIIEVKRLHLQNQAYLNDKENPRNNKNQSNSHLVHFSKGLIYFLVIVFVFVLWLTLR